MQKKILVAVALAVLTIGALYFYSRTLEKEVSGGELEEVLVASTEIQAGTRLMRSHLAKRKLPKQYVHPQAIRPGDADGLIDRPVGTDLKQMQVILWSDFESTRNGVTKGSLSLTIPKGKRALTIPVDTQGSHAGMLRAGDNVDLLGTFVRGANDFATVTLLQKVMVLATGDTIAAQGGQPTTTGPRTFNSITVAVELEEAELLAFAVQRGPVSVVLRSPDDLDIIEDIPTKTFGDIFDMQKRIEFTRRHKTVKKIEALKPQ